MTGRDDEQRHGPDLLRPVSEILAAIEDVLNAPDVVPPPVTLDVALATRPGDAWPCSDWCCTRGCPGPGNSLCRTVTSGECHGRCTCGQGYVRDVVRALQDVVGKIVKPGPVFLVGPPVTWAPIPERCTRPGWLPAALHFHFHACPGGAQ